MNGGQLQNTGGTPAPQGGGEAKPQYTPEQQQACSIDAMLNGGECEACQ